MVGWLVGWFDGWLVGWLDSWLDICSSCDLCGRFIIWIYSHLISYEHFSEQV